MKEINSSFEDFIDALFKSAKKAFLKEMNSRKIREGISIRKTGASLVDSLNNNEFIVVSIAMNTPPGIVDESTAIRLVRETDSKE